MMSPLSRLVLVFAVAWTLGQPGFAAEPPGTLEVQSSLYYRSGGRRLLVRQLQPSEIFQGTAVTRDGNIFLAYTGPPGEATTTLSVYDVNLRKERIIVGLGGTGETEFAYDRSTDLVVFDWNEGIYVFSLDSARKNRPDRAQLDAFKKLIVLAVQCERCFQPRWTKDHKIAYLQYGEQGTQATKYAEVPAAALGAKR